MSLLLLSEKNCYTAPIVINEKCVATTSSWVKTTLPALQSLLHESVIRIPLHTFQYQYVQLSSANGTIDIEAITPFISGILKEKKDYIFNIYSVLYEMK
jgi:hypothetical protein